MSATPNDSIIPVLPLLLYFYFFSTTILYYDHLLTLQEEISYIWSRAKSKSAYLFFLNRYVSFFGTFPIVTLSFVPLSPESCKSYSLFRQVILIAQESIVGVLLTLRVYALYGCDKRVLFGLVFCGISLIGLAGWSLTGQHSSPTQAVPGCYLALPNEAGIHISIAWEALFVYDSLIFTATIIHSKRSLRSFLHGPLPMSILQIVVRDGATYFGVMGLANLANILTFYIGGPYLKGSLSAFASSMSVTMMSRLMLNLHERGNVGLYSSEVTVTELRFREVVNIVRHPERPATTNDLGAEGSAGEFEMQDFGHRGELDVQLGRASEPETHPWSSSGDAEF